MTTGKPGGEENFLDICVSLGFCVAVRGRGGVVVGGTLDIRTKKH